MTTRGPMFDDLAKLMTNAAGVAQGMQRETQTVFRSYLERWMAEQNLPSRDEVDAALAMARKAREENQRLADQVQALEQELAELRQQRGGPHSTTSNKEPE